MWTTITEADWTPIIRIALAAGLTLPIGLEREIKGKAAGVRTLVLLASAAGALGWLSITAAAGDQSSDGTRIASYTVAGISFLGAGLIIGIRGRLYGLTTAVAAFSVTTIGLLAGMGYPLAAVGLTVVTLMALRPVDVLKRHFYGRWLRSEATLHLITTGDAALACIPEDVADSGAELRALEFSPLGGDRLAVHMTVRGHDDDIATLAQTLHARGDVDGLATVAGAAWEVGD